MITSLGAVLIGSGAASVLLGVVLFAAGRRRTRTTPVEESRPHAPTDRDLLPVDTPKTVLVAGASSPSAVAVIRCLVRAGFEVVATDSDALAPGLRLAQLGAVVPPQSAADYPVTLAKLAKRARATLVMAADSCGITALGRDTEVVREAGVDTWLPPPETVRLCSDRWLLHEHMAAAGLPVAPARLASVGGVPGPWFVGPRMTTDPTAGFACDSLDAVVLHASRMLGFVVANRPCGDRFGAEILSGRDKRLIACVSYWRLRSSGQEILAAETFYDHNLELLLQSVASSVNLEGPATVSGVMTAHGAVLTDLELGFGSAVALCASAGADVVAAYVEETRGECKRGRLLAYRSGIRMVRHLDEVFDS